MRDDIPYTLRGPSSVRIVDRATGDDVAKFDCKEIDMRWEDIPNCVIPNVNYTKFRDADIRWSPFNISLPPAHVALGELADEGDDLTPGGNLQKLFEQEEPKCSGTCTTTTSTEEK